MHKLALALGAFFLATTSAFAVAPITGTINFDGNDSYNSTSITFAGSQNAQSDTGALATFGDCTGCLTAQSFTYNPFAGPLDNMISGTNGASHFALDLDSVFNVAFTPGNSLDFDGAALLHLTGFADTPGELFFSTQGPNGIEVSFSATALPTPEPASLAVLGIGLLGLGLVTTTRRRST
jgi:hypothetical protein